MLDPLTLLHMLSLVSIAKILAELLLLAFEVLSFELFSLLNLFQPVLFLIKYGIARAIKVLCLGHVDCFVLFDRLREFSHSLI